MKALRLTILAMTVLLSFNSCSKDDSNKTNATIKVTDSKGPVSGIVVYVYEETQWSVIGDDPQFAQGQASTNSDGVATFSNLEYNLVFNGINNNQNTMRFSAHYTINGVKKTKVTAITFSKGDSKTGSLYLN